MHLTKEQKFQIKKLGGEFNLKLILIYGSYATERNKSGSDLDIAVYGNKKLGAREFLEIYNKLADVFGDTCSRELDVKSLHNINPLFRFQVMRDGILIYGKPYDYHSFRAYAYQNYLDSQGLFKLRDRIIQRQLQDLKQIYVR